ncbi:MAG: zinc ABC transporter solute-binding protein [Deltaproteobacteria bacterium]|nr:zinc ABC transporter solute-binding protein [Deltaproteobacteria bacterium]
MIPSKSSGLLLKIIFLSLSLPAIAASPMDIAVSIPPQAYFVQRIAGNLVKTIVLVPPGRSPASYAPTPKQIVALSKAKIYFSIDVPFEKNLIPKIRGISNNLEIIDSTKGVPKVQGPAGRDMDPHVWLDPSRAAIIAENMEKSLERLLPRKQNHLQAGLESLKKDLNRLDKKFKSMFAPFCGSSFFAFHPAFGYFAKAYGLKQVAVEYKGKEPGGRHLAELIDRAREEGIKAILVQAEFPTAAASTLAHELGARVIYASPLAENYIDNLERLAVNIRKSLAAKSIRTSK